MEITDEILIQIKKKLIELENNWKDFKGMLLSEDDVKCHLFRLLHDERKFLDSYVTKDPDIFGTPIHTEIFFFDENGKLSLKPDITILNPQNLSIAHSVQCYSNTGNSTRYASTTGKMFEFKGKAIVIELTFIKNNHGITRMKDINKIREDFEKIKRIIEINDGDVKGFIVVFSKASNFRIEFDDLKKEIESFDAIEFYWGKSDYGSDPRRNLINFDNFD